MISLALHPLLPSLSNRPDNPLGRLHRDQLQDRKIRLLILSHSLNVEARLLR